MAAGSLAREEVAVDQAHQIRELWRAVRAVQGRLLPEGWSVADVGGALAVTSPSGTTTTLT